MSDKADEIYRRMYSKCYHAMIEELEKQKASGHSSPINIILVLDQLLQAIAEEITNVSK